MSLRLSFRFVICFFLFSEESLGDAEERRTEAAGQAGRAVQKPRPPVGVRLLNFQSRTKILWEE